MKKSLGLIGTFAFALTACSSGNNATSGDSATETPAVECSDALVSGTDYHATTDIACGFGNAEPTSTCPAGVKRNWGEDGTSLVEVSKPDGFKRAISFMGTTPFSADSAESDGSAGWEFNVSRDDKDNSIVKYGPETYVVPDALITGG